MPFKNDNKDELRKRCPRCGVNKLVTEFYAVNNINKVSSYCIKCNKIKAIEWNKINRAIKGSKAWYRRRYDQLRYHYKHQRYPRGFDLTFPQYLNLMKEICYYCGDKIERLGVDRVDNSKGYIESNCVAACPSCNRSKNSVSIEICRKVVEFVDN